MSYSLVAGILQETLGLDHTPVGVAVVDTAPASIRAPEKRALSACTFWLEAEKETFFATAEDHAGCAVGAHVMGLPLSPKTSADLGGTIALMSSIDYLGENEVGNIPQIQKTGGGVVYGPLADFPLVPDCALVWATPAQAMVLSEALGTIRWNAAGSDVQRVFGRPGCGALARTINTGNSSLSLGCIGMRTFTEVAPALALVVIPGDILAGLAGKLRQSAESNGQMLVQYQAKKHAGG